MAEQDWGSYAYQAGLNLTDTLLARTAAGAGVQFTGGDVFAKRGGDSYIAKSAGAIAIFEGLFNAAHGVRIINRGVNATTGGTWFLDYQNENDVPIGSLLLYGMGDGSSQFALRASPPGSRTADHRADVLFADTLAVRPGLDNAQDLGAGYDRWKNVYAASSVINTSDEREKSWRGAANDTELAAARAILDELGFFQWNDAVEAKGDDARLHFGVRAQRVWAIMAEHGLVDPIKRDKAGRTPYAFLCFDEWSAIKATPATDEAPAVPGRAAGNRYGVRVDQLNSFLIAAQHARQNELDQRIAVLEAATTA